MSLEVHIEKKLNGFTLRSDLTAGNTATAILGASGCGKSMTLRCIAGIVKPDKGRIVLDGRVLFDSEQHIDLPPQQRGVGLLFQSGALWSSMTLAENVALPLQRYTKLSPAEIRELTSLKLALVGLAGFIVGILIGIACLKKGFSLKRSYEAHVAEGGVLPTVMAVLLILVVTVPALFKFSEEGPGSKHAPFWIALAIALVVGALAQKSRLCMVGGLRDAFMLKDFHLLYGFVAIFVVVVPGTVFLNPTLSCERGHSTTDS